jgi:hypothetical protein
MKGKEGVCSLPRGPPIAAAPIAGTKADFTSLDQWERELQLYNAIKALPVFKQYKEWKNFKVLGLLLRLVGSWL